MFLFDPLMHVEGDKVVLGQTIKPGGVEEGEQVLRMLAQPSVDRAVHCDEAGASVYRR